MENQDSLKQDIQTVMDALPAPIRAFITSGAARRTLARIQGVYQLHIDQAGVLEQEALLMLIGIHTPDQFTQALKEDARLDDATVNAIAHDINEQIFVPLRKAEREGGLEEKPQTQAPAAVHSATISPIAPSVTQPPAMQEPPSVSILPPRQPEAPVVQTFVPPLSEGTPLPPKMTMPERPQPMREVAPEHLPGAMPAEAASYANQATPVPQASAPERTAPEKPIVKAYAVDPYRESFDDTEGAG